MFLINWCCHAYSFTKVVLLFTLYHRFYTVQIHISEHIQNSEKNVIFPGGWVAVNTWYLATERVPVHRRRHRWKVPSMHFYEPRFMDNVQSHIMFTLNFTLYVHHTFHDIVLHFTYILVHYYDLRSMDNGHCPMYKCIVYTLYIFCTPMHSYMPCTKNIHFSSTYYIVNTLYIFCKSMHPYRHCTNKIHFSSTSQWTEVHGHGRPNLHLYGSLTTSWMW